MGTVTLSPPSTSFMMTCSPPEGSRSGHFPARGDRTNYADLAHAGKPHKGKVTDAEKQLVQENFDEINARLAREGIRTINLAEPEHAERYGLEELASTHNPDVDGHNEDPDDD